MNARLILCLLVCLMTTCRVLRADDPITRADVYVDPIHGNDTQLGTLAEPVRSIPRAQELARKVIENNGSATVLLRAGRHELNAPLVFDTRDSAREMGAVVYAAYGNEVATISGGSRITGWKQAGQLWETELPDVREGKWFFREMFVNGSRRTRARTPNEGFLRLEQAGDDRRTSFTFKPGDLRNWPGVDKMEFVFLHDWSISRIRFASVDEQANVARLADPVGFPAPHYVLDHYEKHPRYFVENALALLDSPGEWFLEPSTGKLTYWPLPGEKLETAEVVAPRLDSLLRISGDAKTGHPLRNLRFERLTFEHCRWEPPAHGYAEGQATKHDPRDGKAKPGALAMVPAAVEMNLAENCAFTGCTFARLGGGGLWLRQEVLDSHVQQCTFNDIAGNGIMLGEIFTRNKATLPNSGRRNGVCRGNHITMNEVSKCGQLCYGAVGIFVGIAAETTVSWNHVHALPYTGISLGWSWNPQPTGAEKNTLHMNRIHDVLQTMSDGGGIYTLGLQPESTISSNEIYNVPLNAGRAESNGIFMDEGSTGFTVANNTIYNIDRSPIRFHKAGRNLVRDNRLAHADKIPMFRYNSTPEDVIERENNKRIGDGMGKGSEERK